MSEEHILDFLDGRLGGPAEEELLHTLAVSPERRQMLRDHLRLRELTSHLSRQERFSVPEHVSSQLFTRLNALGFTAPPTTAAILTHASDYVKRDKPAERPKGMYWSGRRMAGSLAMASIVSFLLGVSAFYVFGERLGLRTLSSQRSASIVSVTHVPGLVTHNQFASAAIDLRQDHPIAVKRIESSVYRRPASAIDAGLASSVEPIAQRDMSAGTDLRLSGASLAETPTALELVEPIIYTAPIKAGESFSYPSPGVSSKYLLNPSLGFDAFDPSPFLSEKGTISFRFGTGRPIRNTTTQWSSLSELKFTWALGKLVTARASLGQLMSYEREANNPQEIAPRTFEITTTPTFKMIPVAGMEMGLALDQFGIPVELSAGALADGAVKFYPRAALFAHYDLLPSLSLGVGMEGIAYKHDISSSVIDKKNTFKDLRPTIDTHSLTTSETAGFLGLAFELGWHF
jgi:hypothetical protein